jgi:hypothetical protein
VVYLEPGADLRAGCKATSNAAEGTLVLVLSNEGDEFERYGCANLPGADDENFGKAFVAETTIASGIDPFADRPLEAMKAVAVNYDGLVKAGIVPDGARTISPSLPRYLLAGAAVAAVLGAAGTLWFLGRRAGRLAARHREERDAAQDLRGSLNAKSAVLAGLIIELDQGMARAPRDARRRYRALAAEYAQVVTEVTDDDVDPALVRRVETLTDRARALRAQPLAPTKT